MLVSTKMITGFNTDVPHEGLVYHVQTEDRRTDDPAFESLVYVGGSIVAKKLTPYSDKLSDGATEDTIASLLKRQHQVIIAAIKAGRIEELIRHTRKTNRESDEKRATGELARVPLEVSTHLPIHVPIEDGSIESPLQDQASATSNPVYADEVLPPRPEQPCARAQGTLKISVPAISGPGDTGGLNLDQVIADYLERDEAKLEVKVLSPETFIGGKSIALRVQVSHNSKPEFDAIVTVKIIGTAFKPQVVIGRVGRDGVASFTLTLPAFSAGTAAIVIEARSSTGRGELKNLIRRA
jgi:hypothetical protein